MAIKAPTPPTPPTPPISPKGDDSPATDAGVPENTGNDAGARDFGVHITISSPETKENNPQNTDGNTAISQEGDKGNTNNARPDDGGNTVQSVQVQGTDANQQVTTQVQDEGPPIHVVNNDSMLGQISVWPFVLIFVMAFLGFSFLNMRNKKIQGKRTNKNTNDKSNSVRQAGNTKMTDTKKNEDDTHGHFEIRV